MPILLVVSQPVNACKVGKISQTGYVREPVAIWHERNRDFL